MDKLLLTLTLVAFSSGVLCDASQNLVRDDSELNDKQLPSGINLYQLFFCNGTVERTNPISGDGSKVDGGCKGVPIHRLHKRQMVWNDARKSCISERGQLVVINSNAEGEMLANWLKKEGMTVAWIGTHDLFKTSDWVTLTGETLEAAGYDNWLSGKPENTHNEHCGTINPMNGMNNYPCDWELPYFCKIYIS